MNLYSIVDEVIEVFQDRSLTYANGLNVGLATISIICTLSSGPIAAGVLLGIGVFTAVDLIYGWTTGSSVTDRLDKKTVIEW